MSGETYTGFCRDCPFWLRGLDDKGKPLMDGECRESPPKVHIVMQRVQTLQGEQVVPAGMAVFPRTAEECWCGAHPARTVDPEPEMRMAN